MSDAKLFARGKAAELRQELSLDKKDKNNRLKKVALKKVVANMTMSNNEMIVLFPEILTCMSIYDLDIKKMCFLYLLTYAKAKPAIAIEAIPILLNDLADESPLIRALALRTLSAVPVKEYFNAALENTKTMLLDEDPYVRKTAAYSVAKLWHFNAKLVEKRGLINELNKLLSNTNPTVVAAALAALQDITEKTDALELTIDKANAFNLAHILPDCNEWSQSYILGALMHYVPTQSNDAVNLIYRVLPRLQHANASVVLGAIRLIVYLSNFVPDIETTVPELDKRIGPAIVILLSKPAEIQYLALRNCILLLQGRPNLMKLDVRVFFCKYNDLIFVKSAKLEIIYLLANEQNIGTVLREFRDCAQEIDVQVVRKAVRAIGKLAIKIEKAAESCIEALLELVSTRVNYIVQEATVVIKNIFRRYPNRYESVISALCDNLDSLDEPEAKASMIWIIGHYADRIENSHILLNQFLTTFNEETTEVQLSLLTAVVKLFILRPTKGQELVPRVLKMATEDSDNPDLRDRGFMYWRLLSTDPAATKDIVMGVFPEITTDSDLMDEERLEELELAIGTLATIYLKPIKSLFRLAKSRRLPDSPALAPRLRSRAVKSQLPTKKGITRQMSLMTLNSDQDTSQGGQFRHPTRAATAPSLGATNGQGSGPGTPNTPYSSSSGVFGHTNDNLIDIDDDNDMNTAMLQSNPVGHNATLMHNGMASVQHDLLL